MRHNLALICFFALAACSDYDLHTQKDPELPADPLDTADPIDPDSPVAVCDVTPNPVTPPFETATWLGEESYDPQGATLTEYKWALSSQPAGSSATMAGGNQANRAGFAADLAGEYVATLTVTTMDGRVSEPCEVTLESIPAEDLWIEMYWTESGDDMDLHLLRPGGALESDNDCYFANCTTTWGGGLDWGVGGDPNDDPSLDLDDIYNTGPENINIADPENGKFMVYVHDYPGSSYNPANTVTVNIYMGGTLEFTDTRAIAGEDSYNKIAEINWTAGTITGF